MIINLIYSLESLSKQHSPPRETARKHNFIYHTEMYAWSELSAAQQNFYMEFFAPIVNNVRQMPDNDDLILSTLCTPGELHINSVTDTGDRLVRSLNFALTPGQHNAVIQWIQAQ